MAYNPPKGNFIRIGAELPSKTRTTYTWIDMPDPKFGSGTVTIATNVNEARNSSGNFVGTVVGRDKIKYELSWDLLPIDEFRTMVNYFNRSAGGSFTRMFLVYDPRVNGWRKVEMYTSDRTGTPIMVSLDGDDTPKATWVKDIKISLVEV